jgi:hypothetical protein
LGLFILWIHISSCSSSIIFFEIWKFCYFFLKNIFDCDF